MPSSNIPDASGSGEELGPKGTAYHEAAHAVAQWRAKLDTGTVTIIPNPEKNSEGMCEGDDDWWDQEQLEGLVIALLAGAAAQIELLGTTEATAKAHGSIDFEEAQYLIEKFDLPAFEEWMSRAREFVRHEEAAIKFIAALLLELKTLDQAEVLCAFFEFEDNVTVEESISTTRRAREIEGSFKRN